ncbi:MAG: FAD-dependent oxidoreductase [Candidatus Wildermuthbacteria bacterium]|nr:FAD-dependent oxidoreductase [Candidatus Wildermuthbacteria bacterium]MBI2121100.1 FAD-dependent oxidoreductase [Candidatus Wildermuthbacteria bacterium]
MERYDLVIIGTGAAGLSAALYAGRYTLKTLVIGKEFGGETSTAWTIENYPGHLSVDGYDLMKIMEEQAQRSGAEVKEGNVVSLKKNGEFTVTLADGSSVVSRALIFASGASRRHLNVPGEKELLGKGVHYCFTCDGPLYGGKRVAVVGGGDSSVKAVNFLSEYASHVSLITIEKALRAEPVNIARMEALGDKARVLYETRVAEFVGKDRLEFARLSGPSGTNDFAVDGVFLEIGFEPSRELPMQLGVALDEQGYIRTDNGMRTNIPGVFGAGDATNHFGSFKQDVTAAALGAVAATSAYEHIRITNP